MNKNGWGLRAELGFLLLFLICLLVATIGLHKMGIFGVGNTSIYNSEKNKNFNYNILEGNVTTACKKYYSSNYPNGTSDTIIISLNTLKNSGYLNPIYDNVNRECKGYAKVLSSGTCVSYIRCSFYKTAGYSEEYE